MAARLFRWLLCAGFGSKATVHNSCRFLCSGGPKYLGGTFHLKMIVIAKLKIFLF